MEWELHHYVWIVCGFFSLLAVSINLWTILTHLRNYTEPRLQKSIVRILLMIPIYTIDSYISLLFKEVALFFDVARDCYEAYVLYIFLRLMIECADGEEALVQSLERLPELPYSVPLCCWKIKPGRIFLHRCKQMIIQFTIIKPVLAVITFILELTHSYEEGNLGPSTGYLWITIIDNISITICLYFLVLFYEATQDILAPYKPIAKFLCIKAVIFFAFWQGVVIAVMAHFDFIIQEKDDWTKENVAAATQNAIICIEMFPLAIAYASTFGAERYRSSEGRQLFQDEVPKVLNNFVDVVNVKDVMLDTITSMKKGPQRNVTAGNFLDLPRSEQMERVRAQGWFEKKGEDLANLWKRRFYLLIQQPPGLLYFKADPFRTQSRDKPMKARGFIDLTQVLTLAPKDGNNILVVTSSRTWEFRCSNMVERDDLLNCLNGLWLSQDIFKHQEEMDFTQVELND